MTVSTHSFLAAGISLKGRRRTNEDRFLILDRLGQGSGLFLVADGLGGHQGGARAADVAVREVEAHLRLHAPDGDPLGALDQAFRRAEEALAAEARADVDLAGMGAVATAALYRPPWLHLAWLGDARAYRRRRDACAQVTRDHTVAWKLLEEGRLTQEELRASPWRNHLLHYLGKPRAAAAHATLDVESGDRLLLATDGAWEWLEEKGVRDLLLSAESPAVLVRAFEERARREPPRDNATILLVVWSG